MFGKAQKLCVSLMISAMHFDARVAPMKAFKPNILLQLAGRAGRAVIDPKFAPERATVLLNLR